MTTGQTVYRGEVYTTGSLSVGTVRHYIATAIATGIEVDGVPMAKLRDMLVPLADYVDNEVEAKRQVIAKLRTFVADVEQYIATLEAEVAKS